MINLFKFDLQLFGGGGGGTSTTVQKVEVAPASAEERRLQAELKGYQDKGLAGAKELQDRALKYLNDPNNILDPDYKQILHDYLEENDYSNLDYQRRQEGAASGLREDLNDARKAYEDRLHDARYTQDSENAYALKDYEDAIKRAQGVYNPYVERETDLLNKTNADASDAYHKALTDATNEYVRRMEQEGPYGRHTDDISSATRLYNNAVNRNIGEHTKNSEDALNEYVNSQTANNTTHNKTNTDITNAYTSALADAKNRYDTSIANAAANYDDIEKPAYGKYVAGMDDVDATYKQLINGELPIAYQTNREQALRNDVSHTLGDYLNNMAKRGIVNSTVSSSGFDSISRATTDTIAKAFSNDIAQVGGLLKDRGGFLQQAYDTSHGKAVNERDNTQNTATNSYKFATDNAENIYGKSKTLSDEVFSNNQKLNEDVFKSRTDTESDRFKEQGKANDTMYNASVTLADKRFDDSKNQWDKIYDAKNNLAKTVYDDTSSNAKNRYATNMDRIQKFYDNTITNGTNLYNTIKKYNDDKAGGLISDAQNLYNGAQQDAQNIYNGYNSSSTNVYNARQQHMTNLLTGNLEAQVGSYYGAGRLLDMADQLYLPSQNQFNQLYAGRHGAATTTTTTKTSGGDDGMMGGLFGAIGTVGSALVTCFAAGTQITTPTGYKNIEDIKVGDEVLSLDENNQIVTAKVKEVLEPHMADTITVQWDNSTRWRTTINQRFYDGSHFAYFSCRQKAGIAFQGLPTRIVNFNEGETQLVYDFVVDNDINVFFANDVAAEGFGD